MTANPKLQIVLSAEMMAAIDHLCERTDQTRAFIVREAIHSHLARNGIAVRNVHPSWGGQREGAGRDREQ